MQLFPQQYSTWFLVVIFAAGCVSKEQSDLSDPGAVLQQDAGFTLPKTDSSTDAVADFVIEWGACDTSEWTSPKKMPSEVQCAFIDVPFNHFSPTGETISLYVARHRQGKVAKDRALFYVQGGPGGSSTAYARRLGPDLIPQTLETHDIYYVDQRGTGGSGFLSCESGCTSTERNCRECATFVGVDSLKHHLSIDAAADIDYLRQILGYQTISMMGASYGSRVALEYLRQYPEHLSALVLDGVVPTTFRIFEMGATRADWLIETLIKNCDDSAECRAIAPDLRKVITDRRLALKDAPRTILYNGYATTETETYFLRVLATARHKIYRYEIPRALVKAQAGEFQYWNDIMSSVLGQAITDGPEDGTLAREDGWRPELSLPRFAPVIGAPDVLSGVLYSLVVCNELAPNEGGLDNLLALAENQSWLGAVPSVEDFPLLSACDAWQVETFDQALREPVQSAKKVLLLSGELDHKTRVTDGLTAAKTLPNSLHLTIPYVGHTPSKAWCAGTIIANYLDANGETEGLDTSCIDSMEEYPWAKIP
jgi:pimeloyl-ACP methyl ester carboxylesterase